MPSPFSRSIHCILPALLLLAEAKSATLLDSLSVSLYRHERVFAATETANEPETSVALVLNSRSPGCGPISIDSVSMKGTQPGLRPDYLRIVVSRTASGLQGCSTWKRQRVIHPLFAGTDSASVATRREILASYFSTARIVLAGSRDSVDLTSSVKDTGRFHVYGGFFALPTCMPICGISHCQLIPASWGYSSYYPPQGQSGTPEVRRRVDSARVVGIRRLGEGVWLPARPTDLPDSFLVLSGHGPADPRQALFPEADRILRTARRIHWDNVVKGDTTGFPTLAVAESPGRPWRLVLQGGTATGDSIVGDTLRLAGATGVFEAQTAIPSCFCPTTWPEPILPVEGTRWLELRYTDSAMPVFSGARPESGEEWFGLRRDSLFATGGMCESQPSRFVSTLAQAISSSIGSRSPIVRAPHLWRSSAGWHLDLPQELGERVDIGIYSLAGEELLSLRGAPTGRADLGVLRSASGVLILRISGSRHSLSIRVPALR